MMLDRREHGLPVQLLFWLLVAAALLLPLLALRHGAVALTLAELVSALRCDPAQADCAFHRAILLEIRLPRVLLAALAGAALALAGVLMQTLFRNPLADPGLVGTAAGAALAGALAIVLGQTLLAGLSGWLGAAMLPLFAFVGAWLAMLAVLGLARRDGRTEVADLLLAGIAINALAGACIGMLVYIASDDQLRAFTVWTLGSLASAHYGAVALAGIALALTATLSWSLRKPLDALLLGDGEARSLGVDVDRLKQLLLLLCALVVGMVVAFCGVIGFIGLVIPNLMRMLIGPGHRLLIPASLLAGAVLLGAADLSARTLLRPIELPIGILTALIGAPFFLLLLRQRAGT